MKLKLGTLILLVVTSFSSQAALITLNGYTLNTDTNIVTGGGLEWLQWDETTGESINSALTTYGSQGWRLASNVEMASLFSAFFPDDGFGNPLFWDVDENTSQTQTITFNANGFISIFGLTSTFTDQDPSLGTVVTVIANAYFGEDTDLDGQYNFASVFTAMSPAFGQFDATLSSDIFSPTDLSNVAGVALVRTPVPIPAAVWLFGSALFGLVSLTWKSK